MLSLAEKTCIAAYAIASALLFFNILLATIPLIMFVLICLIAPFFPTFNFFLPSICRGNRNVNAVAITFDDGPHPETTPKLLQLLAKHHVKATFFVTGKNASQYPELIRKIIAEGHTIGNHTYHHDPFLMLKSKQILRNEIESTQNILKTIGVVPFAFRPPAGITNPRLKSILSDLNLMMISYSCRAKDGGNRWIKDLSKRILMQIRSGDIVLLHDRMPKDPSLLPYWLKELNLIISGIYEKKLAILPLSELIMKSNLQIP